MSMLSKILLTATFVLVLIFAALKYAAGGFVPFMWVVLAGIVICLGIVIAKERRVLKEFLSMKTTKHGMSMGLMSLLVVVFLVLVNTLGLRYYKAFDFSVSRSNTLAPESINLLKSLKGDLKITFFYKKGAEGSDEQKKQFRELVKKYQDQYAAVKLEYVEVNENPALTKEYAVDRGGGIVFVDYQGKRNRVDRIEEGELSSAILKATREKQHTIYNIVGHGEPDWENDTESKIRQLKLLLENNRYTVKTLFLSKTPKIPADAEVLFLFSPKHDLQDFEVVALNEYLKSGGRIMMGLEQTVPVSIQKFLQPLGVEVQKEMILNIVETVVAKGIRQGPTMAGDFSAMSAITKGFQNDMVIMQYPFALVQNHKNSPDVHIDDIVKTNQDSVAIMDFKNVPKTPKMGPYTLGVFINGKVPGHLDGKPEFQMAVYGDSDFVHNDLLFQYLNRDLVLNTVATLVGDEGSVNLTPKEVKATKMQMTDLKFLAFFVVVILGIPLFLLVTGVTLFLRRRGA